MILIVDDDAVVRSSLSFLLKRAGYATRTAANPAEAVSEVRQEPPQLVMLDMNFSLSTTGEEGILLLKQLKVLQPDLPVILMTAWGNIALAVQGMQAGAFDFITKPWNNLLLLNAITTALELSRQRKEAANQPERSFDRTEADSRFRFNNIVGQSEALMEVLATVSRIAPTDASVLITGESGTGKELIAEAIHQNSRRREQPFVKVNLGGLSHSLFESEMFGHKKGAFTDAYIDRTGRFEMAHKGTIFLDEIGDLELTSQVKMLRVLQDRTFEVLGDSRPRKVDVRVVSATNRDLRQLVADRSFREDLFYRINLITIHLPALRERRDDIPLLARHFAEQVTRRNALPAVAFSADAMRFLQQLPFPGNIRELKNLVERTLLVSGKQQITAEELKAQTQEGEKRTTTTDPAIDRLTLDELERQRILQALTLHKGNLSHVAEELGISRAALYRRLEKYHISIEK